MRPREHCGGLTYFEDRDTEGLHALQLLPISITLELSHQAYRLVAACESLHKLAGADVLFSHPLAFPDGAVVIAAPASLFPCHDALQSRGG